uniref:Uncharacterized protein n=1 Tax=Strigamia maritima TaxID=126957 RepID=T1IIL2_STRMM
MIPERMLRCGTSTFDSGEAYRQVTLIYAHPPPLMVVLIVITYLCSSLYHNAFKKSFCIPHTHLFRIQPPVVRPKENKVPKHGSDPLITAGLFLFICYLISSKMDYKWSFFFVYTLCFVLLARTQSESDAKLKQFFETTLELVRPEMKKGSSEIGIEVIDPLPVPDYRYEQTGDLISIHAYFNHIEIPNLSTFKLEDVIANTTGQQVILKFSFPSIAALGDYVFETTTLGVPVANAKGRFQMIATKVRALCLVKLSKDSNGSYRCDQVQLKSSEADVELNMEGLAGDNIVKNILDPRTVYNEYKPRINNKIADAIKIIVEL